MYIDQPIRHFLDKLASKSPEPGGGSVAALTGSLGAGLVSMVCSLTLGKEKYKDVQHQVEALIKESEKLRVEMQDLIQKDTEVYGGLSEVYKMPKNTDAEKAARTCHFGNRYKGTPRQCVSCHAPDDSHRGARGEDCGSCHTTVRWTAQRFDHARETGFALIGAHAPTDCTSCHTAGRMQDPVPGDCHGCHRSQDSHAGCLGTDCASCHTSERWQDPTFDHTREASYALEGKHASLDCHACHTASVETQKLGTACGGCHRGNDAHAGKLGTQCETCHTAAGWRAGVRFDHDLTDYPLIGQHVAVPCEQCHLTPAYKDAASDCYSCHRGVDKHEGSLGRECDSCHSPNGWNVWEFDHARTTGFALDGSHAQLTCAQCHREPATEVRLSRDCASCHARDDVHFGEFGRQCQRCHSTISFRQVRLR